MDYILLEEIVRLYLKTRNIEMVAQKLKVSYEKVCYALRRFYVNTNGCFNFGKDPAKVIDNISNLIQGCYVIVLFSGGKDSLVALHLVKKAAEKNQQEVIALHVDTTVSIPENLRYVEQVCNELGVKLEIVRPDPNYFTLVKKWGFPTIHRRWCCYHLKIKPLKEFILKQPRPRLIFDGIRKEESSLRQAISHPYWHKHFKSLCYHPILHWSHQDVMRYIEEEQLPINPLYAKGFTRASECWCPTFKSVKQFLLLKMHYPEFFEKLAQLENEMRNRGSTLFKYGRRIYLREL